MRPAGSVAGPPAAWRGWRWTSCARLRRSAASTGTATSTGNASTRGDATPGRPPRMGGTEMALRRIVDDAGAAGGAAGWSAPAPRPRGGVVLAAPAGVGGVVRPPVARLLRRDDP